MVMNNDQFLIVQKLPDYYQCSLTEAGRQIVLYSSSPERWVGFRLLTGFSSYKQAHVLIQLSTELNDMTIDNSLATMNNELRLFVQEQDSDVVLRLLKNKGVGIAS